MHDRNVNCKHRVIVFLVGAPRVSTAINSHSFPQFYHKNIILSKSRIFKPVYLKNNLHRQKVQKLRISITEAILVLQVVFELLLQDGKKS